MWMVTGGPGEGGAHVTRAVEEDLRRECASVTILRKLFYKKKKQFSYSHNYITVSASICLF